LVCLHLTFCSDVDPAISAPLVLAVSVRGLAGSAALNPQAYPNERSGCTAICVVVTPTHVVTANAGDSRAVLCRAGASVPLSFDHKPWLPEELRRIEAATG